MLNKNVIPFLTELSSNNNREWFEQNKSLYIKAMDDFKGFINTLIIQMSAINPNLKGLTAKDSVYRIYRDMRFSKDKTPYKTHFAAQIAQNGRKSKNAGFYVHIEPPEGNSMVGGGVYMPEPSVLKAIRNEFYQVPEEINEILNQHDFKKYFDGFWQDKKLKTAPKGFPKDFEHIEHLKLKSFVVSHTLTKTQVVKDNLNDNLVEVYKSIYPLIRLLNTIIDDAQGL